jgi:TonB family protein
MPLNVRRFNTSLLLVLVSSVAMWGQTTTPSISVPAPTSGDLMRERISKAKAYIAVRNYNAAIFELENIRRETADQAVLGVANVLLMNSFLEQGDYKKAQDLLNQFYAAQKTTSPNALPAYLAVAGQVVKSSRSRAERYRSLGLTLSDRSLPLEATNDLERLRETLELVVTQSREMGADKAKAPQALALLEEAGNSRGVLARDDYDARRWRDEVADTREQMTNGRSVVLSAIAGEPTVAAGQPAAPTTVTNPVTTTTPVQTSVEQPRMLPVSDSPATARDREVRQVAEVPLTQASQSSANSQPANGQPVYVQSAPPTQPNTPVVSRDEIKKPAAEPVQNAPANTGGGVDKNSGPLEVGALVPYATQRSQPSIPPAAKLMRASGVVRVDVVVDEAGNVAQIQKVSGPPMLVSAARDAVMRWKFRPFLRDGQPVRANGFVSFNFTL